MSRNTQPITSSRASGGSESPKVCAAATSRARERESINRAPAASNQLTEYSTRMCARRKENNTNNKSKPLITVSTFSKRSIGWSSFFLAFHGTHRPLIELQHVDEHAKQYVDDVVN